MPRWIRSRLGGRLRVFIVGAAAVNPEIANTFDKLKLNSLQGYGLTECAPLVAGNTDFFKRNDSAGLPIPTVEYKIDNPNQEGVGEIIVKGPNVMLGYYNMPEETEKVLKDGWFHTGDLAKIDDEGYIFICGRKKSVIVLKNGKNIFPEEMENLVNKIEGVKESFIFGKQQSEDKENIKINVKIVYDKDIMKNVYNAKTEAEIKKALLDKVKEINAQIPKYKAIRGMYITEEPLIKTTTNKIKRQDNLNAIK